MKDFYEVISAEPGHYRFISMEAVFMELLVGKDKALLFDTGYGYGDLKAQIRKLTDLPLIIVNSHGHVDHTCGNYRFEETVYIHEKDAALCQEHTGEAVRKGVLAEAKDHTDMLTGFRGNILPEDFDEAAYIHGGAGKLAFIKEGDRFDLGGMTLTVYEYPGHTPGSIGLLWEEEKILFTGDAMNQSVWLFLPESLTLQDYKRTLEKAYAMDFDYLYMGHSPVKAEKSMLLDFMDAAEHLDYDKGFPFETPAAPGVKAKVCVRDGYGPEDFDRPGFAGIVITKDRVNI